MYKTRLFLSTLLLLCLMGCSMADKTGLGMQRTHSFTDVRAQFANPAKEFRPAPLWTWNARVNHDDIDRMLVEFRDQGFGGAFIHPRPGMETEYLSAEWFELWRYALERGKELGLDIWIYDENSFPSGFAGGHVQHEMPESYDHQTGWTCDRFPSKLENAGEYDFCTQLDSTWYLFKGTKTAPWRFVGKLPYVDLLYPGVTQKFIDITMSGYEREFPNELGTDIKGVFQDEPAWQKWTPDLPAEFQRDWGYNLMDSLPMLFYEVGSWKQVRFHFLYTKTRMWMDRWVKPWYDYCQQHRLLRTGHYGEHMWPTQELGDYMEVYSYHQMPAIDLLFNTFNKDTGEQFGNVRIVKELSSTANQMGYTRTLSETYGGAGWDLTYQDLKRLGDWEYALGVNFMTQHYANITMEGARKFDWPDFFTAYSPWIADYKTLNDHFARLSLALSQGEQVNDILVIQPNPTLWQYFTQFGGRPHELDDIARSFRRFVNELEEAQVEYDLGSEFLFRTHKAYVKKGKLVMGKRAYSTLILPPHTETLLSPAASLLAEFVKQGGRLIALSEPTQEDAYESEKLKALWTDSRIERTCDLKQLAQGSMQFSNLNGGLLYHHRRQYDEGELLFLVNSSLTEDATGSAMLKGRSLLLMNTMTGEEVPYECTAQEDGRVSFQFHLPPAGSLLLFASTKEDCVAPHTAPVSTGSEELTPLESTQVTRLQDNWLLLDYCTLAVEDSIICADTYVCDACRALFRMFGWENPWQGTVQYKQEIVDSDTLSSGPITVRYKFHVAEDFDFSSMKLVYEKPRVWQASINGHVLTQPLDEHPLDARNGEYSIGSYVHTGENIVELHINIMTIHAEISYAHISGNFSVEPTSQGWELRAPHPLQLGAWSTQGMPFYSWDVGYRQTYEIQDTSDPVILRLGKWEGSLCQVYVNGQKAGIIAYQPYEFDLTPWLREGKNDIEVRCIGTFGNLFGPHFRSHVGVFPPGAEYGIGVVHPGSDYRFLPYGLHAPFTLHRMRH